MASFDPFRALAGVSGKPKHKKKSGHPKVPWPWYARQIVRGWLNGSAGESAWAEANRLHDLAIVLQPVPEGGNAVKGTSYAPQTIYLRMCARMGTKGYKQRYAQVRAMVRSAPGRSRLSENDIPPPPL